MKVKYSNEFNDFEAAVKFQVLSTDEGKKRFNKGFLKLQFIPVLLGFIGYLIEGWMTFGIIFGVLNLLTYLFGKKILIKAIMAQQQKGNLGDPNNPFFQEKSLSLGYAGINCRIGKEQGLVSWQKIKRVGKDSSFIYVFAGEEIQFIIPAKAFAKIEGFDRFFGEFKKFGGKKTELIEAA